MAFPADGCPLSVGLAELKRDTNPRNTCLMNHARRDFILTVGKSLLVQLGFGTLSGKCLNTTDRSQSPQYPGFPHSGSDLLFSLIYDISKMNDEKFGRPTREVNVPSDDIWTGRRTFGRT